MQIHIDITFLKLACISSPVSTVVVIPLSTRYIHFHTTFFIIATIWLTWCPVSIVNTRAIMPLPVCICIDRKKVTECCHFSSLACIPQKKIIRHTRSNYKIAFEKNKYFQLILLISNSMISYCFVAYQQLSYFQAVNDKLFTITS